MSRKNANLNSMKSNGVSTTPPKPYRSHQVRPPTKPLPIRRVARDSSSSSRPHPHLARRAPPRRSFSAPLTCRSSSSLRSSRQTQTQMQAQRAPVLNAASAQIPIQVPLSALQIGNINILLKIQLPGGLFTIINTPFTITTAPATSQQQQQTNPPAAEPSVASAALTAIPATAASSVFIEQHASRVHFIELQI